MEGRNASNATLADLLDTAPTIAPTTAPDMDSGQLFMLGLGALGIWMLIMLLCARKELFRRLANHYLCCRRPAPTKSSRASSTTLHSGGLSRAGSSTRRASHRPVSVSATQHRAEVRRASLQLGQLMEVEAGTGLEGHPGPFVLVEGEGELFVCPLPSPVAPITEESSGAESDSAPRPAKPKRTQHAAITLQAKRELNRMRRAESLRSQNRPFPPLHPRNRTNSATVEEP